MEKSEKFLEDQTGGKKALLELSLGQELKIIFRGHPKTTLTRREMGGQKKVRACPIRVGGIGDGSLNVHLDQKFQLLQKIFN